jgi:nitrile hydratase
MAQMSQIVQAEDEQPVFAPGDRVRVSLRFPIGHYRVPQYVRGKTAIIERVIEPRAVNNEEEGFGRNAGSSASKRGNQPPHAADTSSRGRSRR